jgi:hypothetical protein
MACKNHNLDDTGQLILPSSLSKLFTMSYLKNDCFLLLAAEYIVVLLLA